eukprot:5226917-Heterocapsa_arctica.AAC.1
MGLGANPPGGEAMESAGHPAREVAGGGDLRGRLPSADGWDRTRDISAPPTRSPERGRSPGATRTRPPEVQEAWSPVAFLGAAAGPSVARPPGLPTHQGLSALSSVIPAALPPGRVAPASGVWDPMAFG